MMLKDYDFMSPSVLSNLMTAVCSQHKPSVIHSSHNVNEETTPNFISIS